MARRSGPRHRRPAPSPEQQITFGLSISAEIRAAAWLIAHGYRILARRWKCWLGEIDIIAARRPLDIRRGDSARDFGRCGFRGYRSAETTHRRRSEKLAGQNLMLAIRDVRFDAILVAPGKLPRYIPAAFEAPEKF